MVDFGVVAADFIGLFGYDSSLSKSGLPQRRGDR
jgi:hypothetical protein